MLLTSAADLRRFRDINEAQKTFVDSFETSIINALSSKRPKALDRDLELPHLHACEHFRFEPDEILPKLHAELSLPDTREEFLLGTRLMGSSPHNGGERWTILGDPFKTNQKDIPRTLRRKEYKGALDTFEAMINYFETRLIELMTQLFTPSQTQKSH